ncbi:MAG: class I SAM-dependent methyltransferase [Pseudomonadota bacterium]
MSKEQYEAFPYPARNPKDEAKRLITGSPSHPAEIDTHIYGGRRDWTQPFRALVAGGGTGDALVQLAQVLASNKVPYEIVYLDLSKAARQIAEARIKERGLTGVSFHTASLLEAADFGPFDYIDCCGVLHHLDEPQQGLKALERALKPGGGIGFMVYAPYGRAGVYPVQEAFQALLPDGTPRERLEAAKQIIKTVPEGHPLRRNPRVSDHLRDEAGFYDLLLHTRDQAFTADAWLGELEGAGLALTSWIAPAIYDLSVIAKVPEGMSAQEAAGVAEKLRGTITKHVGYAQRAGEVTPALDKFNASLVPHIQGPRGDLAKIIAAGKDLKVTAQGVNLIMKLPEAAAALIKKANGRRSLGEMAQSLNADPMQMQAVWARVHAGFMASGSLRYSSLKPE